MQILNFGSLNIDHVYTVDHFVVPGETLCSANYQINAGGKGLNQSIALARAGVAVSHAGMIGGEGVFLKELLSSSGVPIKTIRFYHRRSPSFGGFCFPRGKQINAQHCISSRQTACISSDQRSVSHQGAALHFISPTGCISSTRSVVYHHANGVYIIRPKVCISSTIYRCIYSSRC